MIKPFPGPQTEFLSNPADIVIYGGAAGGGKSRGLMMDAARYKNIPGYTAIIFRRTTPQITNPGGLWDKSKEIYPYLKGHPNNQSHTWIFPSNAKIKFHHLQHEKDLASHDGAEYAYIGFDELMHFPRAFFLYLMSRNRTTCGVRPVIRGSTNPCPRSHPTGGWLRILLDWWIGGDGLPIIERSGVLRYFIMNETGVIEWVDKTYRSKEGFPPKSITFIPAKLEDNLILNSDGDYSTSLNSLERVERERLKEGNWDACYDGGMFKSSWFEIVDIVPRMQLIRYWDMAGTQPTPERPEPDYTAGALCGYHKGILYILDMQHFQKSPAGNEDHIKATAETDSSGVHIGMEQEPGSAGKNMIYNYESRILAGYTFFRDLPSGNKVHRAIDWCAMAEQGRVKLLRGPWNEGFVNEAVSFPMAKKDQIDAISGAYKKLSLMHRGSVGGIDMYDKESLLNAMINGMSLE